MAKKMLHSGARWLFRIRAYVGMIFVCFVLSFPLSVAILVNPVSAFISVAALLVFVIAVGEIYSKMAYNRWFFEFTQNELKIERGVIWKTYSNIPYSRIQNVDVTRGIIARLLGFSTVHVQTAGYSAYARRSSFMSQSEGHIPAVPTTDAEKIRDFVMKKVGRHGRGGL
ncbi:MAG: PH domain-containing protein [Candidatus Aenigmatarchaeota archaeon]